MSVRGEFERILGDTTAALRVQGEPDLAERLEREAALAGDVLTARAEAVLAVVDGLGDTPLRETLDHLIAISRVVVGPGPPGTATPDRRS